MYTRHPVCVHHHRKGRQIPRRINVSGLPSQNGSVSAYVNSLFPAFALLGCVAREKKDDLASTSPAVRREIVLARTRAKGTVT